MTNELLPKLQSETQSQVPKMESKHLQFIVILVDEADPQEIPAIISRVTYTLIVAIGHFTYNIEEISLGQQFQSDELNGRVDLARQPCEARL